MDWTGLGLRDRVVNWLEEAAEARYAQDRRLDPFATSMRDFDDASAHMKAIRSGNPPEANDPKQRIVDLKNAGFVAPDGGALSELGFATLEAWERFGVDSDAKSDELPRLLLMALEARRIADPGFEPFFDYWSDLRTHFDPLDLIQNWDSLYQINYLDFERAGFTPGTIFRDEKVAVADIEFDLADYAVTTGASELAVQGGRRIEDAIGGKVPRGRHRATFGMALEIVLSEGKAAPAILSNFGFPKKPGLWVPFNETQNAKVAAILEHYGAAAAAAIDEPFVGATTAEPGEVPPEPKPAPTLPIGIDFSAVLVDPPKPKKSTPAAGGKGGAPKKIDYKQKAHANDAVGKLGEDFAIAFERWRLRDHPELLAKLRHVSKEDDTLGYDIESFELNGEPRFIEVKGTLGPMETRFFLSAAELACAESNSKNYVVLRVADLSGEPKCCEIRYPFDGTLDLKPATYSVTFAEEELE